jgi:hypothetical protein
MQMSDVDGVREVLMGFVEAMNAREDGEWKIFQSHTSFPVSNDEVFSG